MLAISVASPPLGNGEAIILPYLTRFEPFIDFRTEPGTNVNSAIIDNGFTGNRYNTSEDDTEDPGLIYMNARYYVPEVGRFASPDTVVPDPQNPQSFKAYHHPNTVMIL